MRTQVYVWRDARVGESTLCIMMLVSGRLNWKHSHGHICSATSLSGSGNKIWA